MASAQMPFTRTSSIASEPNNASLLRSQSTRSRVCGRTTRQHARPASFFSELNPRYRLLTVCLSQIIQRWMFNPRLDIGLAEASAFGAERRQNSLSLCKTGWAGASGRLSDRPAKQPTSVDQSSYPRDGPFWRKMLAGRAEAAFASQQKPCAHNFHTDVQTSRSFSNDTRA